MAAVKKVKPSRQPIRLVPLTRFGACVCALQIFETVDNCRSVQCSCSSQTKHSNAFYRQQITNYSQHLQQSTLTCKYFKQNVAINRFTNKSFVSAVNIPVKQLSQSLNIDPHQKLTFLSYFLELSQNLIPFTTLAIDNHFITLIY